MNKKTVEQKNKSKYLSSRSSLKSDGEEVCYIFTKKDLADILKISISYIDKLMAEEGLPHYKLGKSVRFRECEVMAFLERRKRP